MASHVVSGSYDNWKRQPNAPSVIFILGIPLERQLCIRLPKGAVAAFTDFSLGWLVALTPLSHQ